MRFQRIVFAWTVFLCGYVITLSPALALEKCAGSYGSGKNTFSLATGSPGELGLLKVLGEAFGNKADAALCWVKQGPESRCSFSKTKKWT